MVPTSVSVPELHTRRGAVLRRYAADLAERLRLPLQASNEVRQDSLLVSDDAVAAHITRLSPFEETSVLSRGSGRVMIPVGNGESGVYAATRSMPIVKALGLPVTFYHTTWRDPGLPEGADASAHVSQGARDAIRRVRGLATDMRIGFDAVVETAEGIVDGVLLRALTDRCCLIVVARGRNTGKGSYVDQWLAKSPIPLLVMGRKEAVR